MHRGKRRLQLNLWKIKGMVKYYFTSKEYAWKHCPLAIVEDWDISNEELERCERLLEDFRRRLLSDK